MSTTYQVMPGDTLFGIARKQGVSVRGLAAANDLAPPYLLRPGMLLRIPGMTSDPLSGPLLKPSSVIQQRHLSTKDYFTETTPKTQITLHFTAGTTVEGALQAWRTDPVKVATAYIVDLDGTVVEAFDPKYWAYHLGLRGAVNANWACDRQGIGIELVNVGNLQPTGPYMSWWTGEVWCGSEDTVEYRTLPTAWRGNQHWAAFPEKQVRATRELVRQLCRDFSIPFRFLPPEKRFICDPEGAKQHRGVLTHANYLQTKLDIGPAFPWDILTEGAE
jgi:N-acetyl-anhydromuramyl-L-alanine amidase AmpD